MAAKQSKPFQPLLDEAIAKFNEAGCQKSDVDAGAQGAPRVEDGSQVMRRKVSRRARGERHRAIEHDGGAKRQRENRERRERSRFDGGFQFESRFAGFAVHFISQVFRPRVSRPPTILYPSSTTSKTS